MALNTTRSMPWSFEGALLLQDFQHVPGNRLALAVGVGGEDQLVGILDRLGDVGEPLLRLGVDLPEHVEVGVRVDRAILRRQVADMAERGQNLVAGPEVFVDRFRLGRRLDNHNVHENTNLFSAINRTAGAGSWGFDREHG